MGTSLSYDFQNINVDTLIKEAFERCGIINALENGIFYESANRSGNFLFSSWINEGLNLFTVEQNIINIVPGQSQYALPRNTSKILESKNSSSNRILNGTAAASSGDAAFAFDGIATTACTQTDANGWIKYTYLTGQPINYVGILSATSRKYRLSIQCSFLADPTDADWITCLNTPSVSYYFGEIIWFSLPFTKSALSWRIIETGGATLDIAELYFNIPYTSIPMKGIGRDSYMGLPTNSQTGTSNTYWLNRIQTPTLNVYPVPDNSYQLFVYNRVRYIQDLGDFINSLDTVQAFLEPLAAGLACKVAEKFKPERVPQLKAFADEVYLKAGRENTENVDLHVIMGTGAQ